MSRPSILVYGATSYTAVNHLLPYLVNHPEANKFDLVLAGRSAERLQAANTLIGGGKRELIVCDLADFDAVGHMVQRADLFINLAGEYSTAGWQLGPYAVKNAVHLVAQVARAGKKYLDLTGEVFWVEKQVMNWDFLAAKTGAVIVPMCGFEAAPGDMCIYQSLRTLQDRAGRNVGIKDTTNYYAIRGGISGGTMASVTTVADARELNTHEYSLLRANLPHPKPYPKLVIHTPEVPGAPSVGGFFMFNTTNIPCYRRSWFLSRLGPNVVSSTTVHAADAACENEPRHGDNIHFQEGLIKMGGLNITSTFKAFVFSAIALLFGGLYMYAAWFRSLLKPYVPPPGTGPSMDECINGSTKVTNVSFADNGLVVVTKYSAKGDPGYAHTSKLLTECALSLILPPPKGTTLPPLSRRGGVLTPSTAFGQVLIERLRRTGVAAIESEIVNFTSIDSKKDD